MSDAPCDVSLTRRLGDCHQEKEVIGSGKSVTSLGDLFTSLPTEIIGTIFSHACSLTMLPASQQEDDQNFKNKTMTPHTALTITHVCRFWREVALTTPSMWSYIHIYVPRRSIFSIEALIRHWSTHAKEHPLTISLELTQFASFKTAGKILEEVRHLIHRILRWRPSLDSENMPLTVSVTPAAGYPFVTETITWSNKEILDSEYTQGFFCLNASLKLCILLNGHKDLGPNLVHLDLCDVGRNILLTVGEAIEILDIYTNLKYLSLNIGYPYGMEDVGSQRVRLLPSLKTLSITSLSGTSPAPILNALCAPKLSIFKLDCCLSFSENEPSLHQRKSLLNLMYRSQPPLRGLEMHNIRCSDFYLVQVLEYLSDITELEHLCLDRCIIDQRKLLDLGKESEDKWVLTSEILKKFGFGLK